MKNILLYFYYLKENQVRVHNWITEALGASPTENYSAPCYKIYIFSDIVFQSLICFYKKNLKGGNITVG